MALLRSDIINNEFILSALRTLEKTKHVELETITTDCPVEGIFQDTVNIQVTATVRGKKKEYWWIAKLSSRHEAVAEAVEKLGIWEKEIQVYRELLPYFDSIGERMDIDVPVHPDFISSQIQAQKECILLSDISTIGFQSSCFPLNNASVFMAIQYLARFHALGYSYYKSGAETKWLVDSIPFAGKSINHIIDQLRSCDVADSSVRVEYASRLETLFSSDAYTSICKEVFSPREELFTTVCHGRPTVPNLWQWSVENKPAEAIFVNFSEARLCQPAVDLAIFLYTSTERHFRKTELKNVLKEYHNELEDSLLQLGFPANTYTFYQLVEDYQEAVVPAVGVAVNMLPGILDVSESLDETDSAGSIATAGKSCAVLLYDIAEELIEMKKI